jgi:hypothetical protein
MDEDSPYDESCNYKGMLVQYYQTMKEEFPVFTYTKVGIKFQCKISDAANNRDATGNVEQTKKKAESHASYIMLKFIMYPNSAVSTTWNQPIPTLKIPTIKIEKNTEMDVDDVEMKINTTNIPTNTYTNTYTTSTNNSVNASTNSSVNTTINRTDRLDDFIGNKNYKGNLLEHWREAFQGENCGQVFLHYNNIATKGSKENLFDRRPHLGLPAWFKK